MQSKSIKWLFFSLLLMALSFGVFVLVYHNCTSDFFLSFSFCLFPLQVYCLGGVYCSVDSQWKTQHLPVKTHQPDWPPPVILWLQTASNSWRIYKRSLPPVVNLRAPDPQVKPGYALNLKPQHSWAARRKRRPELAEEEEGARSTEARIRVKQKKRGAEKWPGLKPKGRSKCHVDQQERANQEKDQERRIERGVTGKGRPLRPLLPQQWLLWSPQRCPLMGQEAQTFPRMTPAHKQKWHLLPQQTLHRQPSPSPQNLIPNPNHHPLLPPFLPHPLYLPPHSSLRLRQRSNQDTPHPPLTTRAHPLTLLSLLTGSQWRVWCWTALRSTLHPYCQAPVMRKSLPGLTPWDRGPCYLATWKKRAEEERKTLVLSAQQVSIVF